MGLDVYKYEYDKQGDSKVYINQTDLMNPYFKSFIKKYFQYLESEMNEYYDIKKYIQLNNIQNVNFTSYINNSDKFVIVLLDNTEIKVKTDDMPVEIRLEYYLRVTELEYQRKQMSDKFYIDYLNQNKYMFWTNTQLRQIKPLSDKDSNIRKWGLDKNQFIVCDW